MQSTECANSDRCHRRAAEDADPSDHAPPADDKPPARLPDEGGRIDVELLCEAADCDPPFDPWAVPLLARVVRTLGWTAAGLSVALVGDDRMAQLHRRYRQMADTTDVLTFDLREPVDLEGDTPFSVPLEAELVLCVDEAARQAARLGHETRQELLLYAVHGLLHLAGCDDHEPAAAAEMHRREDALLTALGLPAVYGRDEHVM